MLLLIMVPLNSWLRNQETWNTYCLGKSILHYDVVHKTTNIVETLVKSWNMRPSPSIKARGHGVARPGFSATTTTSNAPSSVSVRFSFLALKPNQNKLFTIYEAVLTKPSKPNPLKRETKSFKPNWFIINQNQIVIILFIINLCEKIIVNLVIILIINQNEIVHIMYINSSLTNQRRIKRLKIVNDCEDLCFPWLNF